MSATDSVRAWPGETLPRVPYWVYQDEATYHAELRRIFEGPTWSFVCLESDLARPGDFRTTVVGEMPVIVVRARDGAIRAFENRCAHRGALIALDDHGSARRFPCVYHAWTYDHEGNLTGIALEKGSDGRMDLFATGRYLDAVVEEAGALRFRERLVVCDSSRVDTLLAIPL